MSRIAKALKVSRPHLSWSLHHVSTSRGRYRKVDDEALVKRIRAIVDVRPTYGYRRVHEMLNRQEGCHGVNHKRVYRVMKQACLLLVVGSQRPVRPHDGKVITLKSNLRWCTDMFEIRCWNGEKVHVGFVLDCCDRAVISWVAKPWHLDSTDVCDLMAQGVESRFDDVKVPHPIEWLSDNGPPYIANNSKAFAKTCGLLVRNTPAYSPESNGMAEAFVKTFKRDYVYVNDVDSAASVLAQMPMWFIDYNEVAPHKGLRMLSPKMFLAKKQS